MEHLILGLSGRKSSGKNTAANQIVALQLNDLGYKADVNEQGKLIVWDTYDRMGILDLDSKKPEIQQWLAAELWPFVKLYSFADPLKEFCMNVFGLTVEQCYGTDDDKNTLTNLEWECMPDYHSALHPSENMTAREVLQYFGTNICRKMNGDCWVTATINKIKAEKPALAVITDVRFPNEVEGVQQAGGKVIRLTRAPFKDSDNHPSETALDDYMGFDAILDNPNSSIPEQAEKLIEILVGFGWFTMEEHTNVNV